MQRAVQHIVSMTETEGFASGCLIMAAVARSIATERERFGWAPDQFIELAEVLEARAAGNQRVIGPRETDHRSRLRLVGE